MTQSRIFWNIGEKPPKYEDFHCDICMEEALYIYIFMDLNNIEKHEFLAVCDSHFLSDSNNPPKWFCKCTCSSERSFIHFFTKTTFEDIMKS